MACHINPSVQLLLAYPNVCEDQLDLKNEKNEAQLLGHLSFETEHIDDQEENTIEAFFKKASQEQLDQFFQSFKNAFKNQKQSLGDEFPEIYNCYKKFSTRLSFLISLLPSSLTTLNLSDFSLCDENEMDCGNGLMGCIADSLQNLETLNLSNCYIDDLVAKSFVQCDWKALKILNIRGASGNSYLCCQLKNICVLSGPTKAPHADPIFFDKFCESRERQSKKRIDKVDFFMKRLFLKMSQEA